MKAVMDIYNQAHTKVEYLLTGLDKGITLGKRSGPGFKLRVCLNWVHIHGLK
jgi:hypothetical protein